MQFSNDHSIHWRWRFVWPPGVVEALSEESRQAGPGLYLISRSKFASSGSNLTLPLLQQNCSEPMTSIYVQDKRSIEICPGQYWTVVGLCLRQICSQGVQWGGNLRKPRNKLLKELAKPRNNFSSLTFSGSFHWATRDIAEAKGHSVEFKQAKWCAKAVLCWSASATGTWLYPIARTTIEKHGFSH